MSSVADQQATVAALLAADFVLVPRSFIGDDEKTSGRLADFVRQRRGRAIDLYMLALAASGSSDDVPPVPAAVWGRALGLEQGSAAPIISRLWRWLEEEGLLTSTRIGRTKTIRLIRTSSGGDDVTLSSAFFRGNFHNRLSMPAKAVLLAILAEGGRLSFLDESREIYGLNRDTVRRGLSALRTIGLLRVQLARRPAPLSARGFVVERVYTLLPPFAIAATTADHGAR